ncbi:MAG: MscL family protein [Flavonifractor plautii]
MSIVRKEFYLLKTRLLAIPQIRAGQCDGSTVGVIIGGGSRESPTGDISHPCWHFAGDNEALAGLSIPLPGGGDLMLGSFLNAVLSFLIMAFVVFCIVKLLNRLHKKEEAAPPPPPKPSAEEALLTEIRDLLKEQKNG